MKSKFLETRETYDGAQLVSLRNYLQHGLLGDSVVAWVGPCAVSHEHMVDGEDLVAGAEIRGREMLHFIIEKFDSTLLAGVALQRLFAGIVREEIVRLSPKKDLALALYRDGDDLFADGKKLSISIATQSPVNSLIHFAVNVINDGTPVPTLSLRDLDMTAEPFAKAVMSRFVKECESIIEATHKVRWVR